MGGAVAVLYSSRLVSVYLGRYFEIKINFPRVINYNVAGRGLIRWVPLFTLVPNYLSPNSAPLPKQPVLLCFDRTSTIPVMLDLAGSVTKTV